MTQLPFWTYLPEFNRYRKEILKRLEIALGTGKLILGKNVGNFERKFASFLGNGSAIGVGNGTDALFLALKALGIGRGDEVVTVPNTAIPTIAAIVAAGAQPVLTEITADTLLLDPDKLEHYLTPKTRCIIPVHLYGQSCRMSKIREIANKHKIALIEDTAQALGAESAGKKAGTFGILAAFSFYPTKIIGAYGDGGAIYTEDPALEKKIRMLRFYGTSGDYYSQFSGYNSRLDEIQAALLLWKLGRIRTLIAKRRKLAQRYQEGLSGTSLELPRVVLPATHVWHLYVVRHPRRDRLIELLRKKGINLAVHYRYPLHLMPAYTYLGYKKGDFPIAEAAADSVVSLPLYPELPLKNQTRIISELKKALRKV